MTFTAFIVVAALTAALSIILMDAKVLIMQAVLFLAFYFAKDSSPEILVLFVSVLQIVLGLFALYKCTRFIDYDYYLQLEKTRKIRPNLTKGGNRGGNFALFRKPF